MKFSFFLFSAETRLNHEENNDIWQPMNTYNRVKSEQTNRVFNDNYHFEPIDHDLTSTSTNHFIQRPVPICNAQSKNFTSYGLSAKRNSTTNIDVNNRSCQLARSVTSDHLATNTKYQNKNQAKVNRLQYWPSVQDVLDALEQRSYEKESFV